MVAGTRGRRPGAKKDDKGTGQPDPVINPTAKPHQPSAVAAAQVAKYPEMSPNLFWEFSKSIDNTSAALSTAQMENASAWKKAKNAGVNNDAMKVARRVRDMSPDQQRDRWRQFHEFARFYNVGGNEPADLVETAQKINISEEEAEGRGYEAAKAGRPADDIDADVYQVARTTTAWRRGFAKFAAPKETEGGAEKAETKPGAPAFADVD